MFMKEQLQKVKTIIVHDNCADGLASAIILHQVLSEAKLRFLDYGQNDYLTLQAEQGMLFCDICPPFNAGSTKWKEFLAAGALVLDHHKGAEAVINEFAKVGQGVFADEILQPGVSGAQLAFNNVWCPMFAGQERDNYYQIQSLAKLVGIRDTWQRNDPKFDEASALSSALLFYERADLLSGEYFFDYHSKYEERSTKELNRIGRVLLNQRRNKASKLINEGYQIRDESHGLTILIVESEQEKLTSDVADLWKYQVDIVVGFKYITENNKCKLNLSFRSTGEYNVMELAKRLGGGGHYFASGACFEVTDYCNFEVDNNPFEFIFTIISKCF